MALNLRNAEAEHLADELARLTGKTKTQVVTEALREQMKRIERPKPGPRLADELDAIALHCAALPLLDRRPADEILGYDEDGLPG